jgi:hypothetical protein
VALPGLIRSGKLSWFGRRPRSSFAHFIPKELPTGFVSARLERSKSAANGSSYIGGPSHGGICSHNIHVVDKGIPVMEMKGKSTKLLERLLDSSGHTVGLIVVGFDFAEGQESRAAKLGKEIGEELAQQIPSKSKLFEAGK